MGGEPDAVQRFITLWLQCKGCAGPRYGNLPSGAGTCSGAVVDWSQPGQVETAVLAGHHSRCSCDLIEKFELTLSLQENLHVLGLSCSL